MKIIWKGLPTGKNNPMDEMYQNIPMTYMTQKVIVEDNIEGYRCDKCGAIEPSSSWNCTYINDETVLFECIHCENPYTADR